jgi:hypothetical protein
MIQVEHPADFPLGDQSHVTRLVARQEPANYENSRRIGVPPVSPRTYALKCYEPLRGARRYAEDSNGPQRASHHERMPMMLG